MDPETALADFDAARDEWETAFGRVPDAALTYLKAGDDYALGGLQVHVNWVLAHYLRVLRCSILVEDPPLAESARLGLTSQQRQEELAAMAGLHQAVTDEVAGIDASAWQRKTDVVYAPDEDPYPTSPEDVLGWLTEHYREHVQQSADLIEDWRAGS